MLSSSSRTRPWAPSSSLGRSGGRRGRSTSRSTMSATFQKRHFDDRLGWHETIIPRRTVRDELITQLTRSASTSAEWAGEGATSEPDTFAVKPVRDLRTP
ncbi:hypothetical protein C458_03630 [Haloferax sp. ATCC BAA-644]|nr:hypothetical protein C460_02190 [Haloferax sp. ATCC BAA-646]ELZ61485.1 hypothetical protein C459_15001 [Haloferax sp. ATCC BAA-645]ELZ70366.1 hypothetical protein C458_03630 [Haloferax sp. ATCC BAA-644]